MANNIVCLIGSVKQKAEWLKATQELTRRGWVVLDAGDYTTENEKPKYVWDVITMVHRQKIEMASVIAYIPKPDGSIGEHTRADMNHALKFGKLVISIATLFEETFPPLEKSS